MQNLKTINSDVLIIGCGGAGIRAAVEATTIGSSVAIVSKSLLGKAHTVMAEGGIAAAVANVDSKDSWEVHFADTIIEGAYLSNWRMVEILVKEAPERVYELERYGALFDRTKDGKIMQRAFGAHTYRRLCHVGDRTGLEMIRVLEDKVLHSKDVNIFDETIITKLVKRGNKIIGAVGFFLRTGEFVVFNAKSVIIATGGLGRIYKVTSNSWETTGDGIALAFGAGADLMDMEMVQFHPTGMVWPFGVKGLLVTEGVRGEGGILLNNKGERFMLKYSPEKKELDARDIVARAVYHEINKGNGTQHGGVYLDISYKGANFVKEKLPSMYTQFKELADVDITKDKMEVAPTVHYFMGGIMVDPETGMTNVKGLFAAGEAASGVHGANRLGGNSLADILVFGKRTGLHAAEYSKKEKTEKVKDIDIKREIARINSYFGDGTNPHILTEKLRSAMSEHVGIVRSAEGLNRALKTTYELKALSKKDRVKGNLKFNQGLVECIEIDNMLVLAECMIRSALERKECRGAHTRRDYPKRDDPKWNVNIICKNVNGSIKFEKRAVPEMPERLRKLITKKVGS